MLRRGKRVAYEVLMGLHYLHGFKVVMLDLKSPNVLLAADGTAKLADVGLARLMSVTSLSHRMPTGTWAWAAPEALLGNRVWLVPLTSKITSSFCLGRVWGTLVELPCNPFQAALPAKTSPTGTLRPAVSLAMHPWP